MINTQDALTPEDNKKDYKEDMIIHEGPPQKEEIKIGPQEIQKDILQQKLLSELDIQVYKPIYNQAVNKIEAIFKNIVSNPQNSLKDLYEISNDLIKNVKKKPIAFMQFMPQDVEGDYLYSHSVNVAILLIILGISAGYDDDTLNILSQGGLLHDLGMMKIPKNFLMKEGYLTKSEFSEIKKHTKYGVEILSKLGIELKKEIFYIIYQHHEREDGSGYPEGLKSNQIFALSKLAVVINIYDSVTHRRPYGDRIPPTLTLRSLAYGAGKLYDIDAVRHLIRELTTYPPSSLIRLDTGEIGEVIYIDKSKILRPIIKIIFDSEGNRLKEPKHLDLSQTPSKNIKDIIDPADLGLQYEYSLNE